MNDPRTKKVAKKLAKKGVKFPEAHFDSTTTSVPNFGCTPNLQYLRNERHKERLEEMRKR